MKAMKLKIIRGFKILQQITVVASMSIIFDRDSDLAKNKMCKILTIDSVWFTPRNKCLLWKGQLSSIMRKGRYFYPLLEIQF